MGAFTNDFQRGEWTRMIDLFRSLDLKTIQLSVNLLDEIVENPALVTDRRNNLDRTGLSIYALGAYKNIIAPNPLKRASCIAYVRTSLARRRAGRASRFY